MNRPKKRNALNDPTVGGIEAFFSVPRTGVKAVVLDAEGPHFCAGLDLSELTERDAFEGLEHSRMWHRAFERLELGRLPVVAVLKGAVIGVGWSWPRRRTCGRRGQHALRAWPCRWDSPTGRSGDHGWAGPVRPRPAGPARPRAHAAR